MARDDFSEETRVNVPSWIPVGSTGDVAWSCMRGSPFWDLAPGALSGRGEKGQPP